MTFKVGDRVVFGVDQQRYPLWNSKMFNGGETCPTLISAEVCETHPDGGYWTKHRVGQADMHWSWPASQPTASTVFTSGSGTIDVAEAIRLWWPRLAVTAAQTAAVPQLPKTVWTETVSLGRRNDLPDPVLAQMIDRGERGVRRGLRSWPENRRLVYRQERIKGDIEDTVKICWHFEPIEPE